MSGHRDRSPRRHKTSKHSKDSSRSYEKQKSSKKTRSAQRADGFLAQLEHEMNLPTLESQIAPPMQSNTTDVFPSADVLQIPPPVGKSREDLIASGYLYDEGR